VVNLMDMLLAFLFQVRSEGLHCLHIQTYRYTVCMSSV